MAQLKTMRTTPKQLVGNFETHPRNAQELSVLLSITRLSLSGNLVSFLVLLLLAVGCTPSDVKIQKLIDTLFLTRDSATIVSGGDVTIRVKQGQEPEPARKAMESLTKIGAAAVPYLLRELQNTPVSDMSTNMSAHIRYIRTHVRYISTHDLRTNIIDKVERTMYEYTALTDVFISRVSGVLGAILKSTPNSTNTMPTVETLIDLVKHAAHPEHDVPLQCPNYVSHALVDIGEPAIPSLIQILDDPEIGYFGRLTLAGMGRKAKVAIPKLKAMLNSTVNSETRKDIQWAIDKISR